MTVTKGVALSLTVTLASVVASMSGRAAGAAGPRLTAISSRLHNDGASLVIEATAPVPYVATRHDPLTVFVDFRNVGADGLANSVAASTRSPIAGVDVQPVESMGAPASRVRIVLTQPVEYRVRSERNTIVLDFEKPKSAPYIVPAVRARNGVTAPLPALAEPPAVDPIAALGLDNAGKAVKTAALERKADPAPASSVPQAAATMATTTPTSAVLTPKLEAAPAAGQAAGSATVRPSTTPPPPQQVGEQRAGARRYTGHPISLDFQGADLRSVLRVFAEESGLNIVIDPAVQGTVDVALHDVPWDQALDIILRANKLGYIVDGTIVRIAPLSVLADEETQRRKLGDEQALAGELRVMTKTLSYAKGEELQALLTKSTLSQRGTVQVDPRTNTIIVTDLADRLSMASELITTLDKPQPQVEIEARIVQANKNYTRALGVQWGFLGRVDPALGNTTNLAFPNSGNLGGRTGGTQGPTGNTTSVLPTGVNLGVPGATSAVGLALGSVNGAFNLDVALTALETSGNLRVLSTPRVSTQNNGEAEITQGVQIPIQTVANNTVTVSFKDAALTLKVTPQITSAGTVIMKISLENAQPDFSRAVNGIPPINTQRANTTVLVSDGQTTVIGGIYVSQEQTANDRTPGVSRIPILGWLFQRNRVDDTSQELLIFITPKIIKA
jgi:type IV pilus secretin PilQ/predicted competence protein